MIVEGVDVTGTYTPLATNNKTSELTRPQSPVEMEMEMMLIFPTLDITVPGSPRGKRWLVCSFQIWFRRNGTYLHRAVISAS